MMVAELGVTEEGAPTSTSKAQWIESALLDEIPHRYPGVRLVNYFFRDKSREGEGNFRFRLLARRALGAWVRAASSQLYGGPTPLAPAQNRFPVRVLSPAQVRPRDEAPASVMSGNDGYFHNGENRARVPRLRVGR